MRQVYSSPLLGSNEAGQVYPSLLRLPVCVGIGAVLRDVNVHQSRVLSSLLLRLRLVLDDFIQVLYQLGYSLREL